jgi:hypothetical protein
MLEAFHCLRVLDGHTVFWRLDTFPSSGIKLTGKVAPLHLIMHVYLKCYVYQSCQRHGAKYKVFFVQSCRVACLIHDVFVIQKTNKQTP